MICKNKSTSKLMSRKLVLTKIYLVKTREMVSDMQTISLLRQLCTYTTLIAFRPKSFNCRTMTKILIHLKYVKNENNFGIVRNSETTRKKIPANIKMDSYWKLGLQSTLNITFSLFSRWKVFCGCIFFYDVFKDINT